MSSNAEVAEEMYVSVNTIKAHLKSLYRKLEVSSRRAAVRRARELNLIARSAKPRVGSGVRGRLSRRSPNPTCRLAFSLAGRLISPSVVLRQRS